MGNLAQLDLKVKGEEARLRALLEDFIELYKGFRPGHELALAIWYDKVPGVPVQNLLLVFTGPIMNTFVDGGMQAINWRAPVGGPPFAKILWTSLNFFSQSWQANRDRMRLFQSDRSEVLYFNKSVLPEDLVRSLKIVTEPSGLMKGWYLSADQPVLNQTIRRTLSSRSQSTPEIGLVKIRESDDFENCRGLIHVEISQRWVPLSPLGLNAYTFYQDWQNGNPGFFLFQLGSLYQIVTFEARMAPEYAAQFHLLEKTRDDRYAEVYLRAVHPPEQPVA